MLITMKQWLKKLGQLWQDSKKTNLYKFRVTTIEQDDNGDYSINAQIINKNMFVKMKPEEILADDELTNSFSPLDVRTLTYLGYLGLNSPQYKILAQRLSEKDNRLVFAIKEKGKKKPIIKTADEISTDEELLGSLDQKDAHMVGFTAANESAIIEKQQRKTLLKKQ
jgi:hypothetical protein